MKKLNHPGSIKNLLLAFSFISILSCQSGSDAPGNKMPDYGSEVVASWNKLVMDLAVAEDGLLTLKGVRTASMMHLAMHDALNIIDPRYDRYILKSEPGDAHPLAAVAQAAHEVVLSQYPGEKPALDKELMKWLQTVEAGPAKEKGIELGKTSSKAILKHRENDGWDNEAEYTWHPMAPGVYAEFAEHSGTPEGFVFGAGWATAKPFMLNKQDQFRSPPPPAIDSDAYTSAYNEVKDVGSFQSSSRTPDQAHLAMWWKDFVENSHNRLARELVVAEKTDLWETARIFALLNMSVCDAYINVFENKFYYNHWRPYTAIRWAANDGNPSTVPDSQWNNLHKHTYAFPSYPSAHGTASAAAMTVLANMFGDAYPFTMSTVEVDSAGPYSGKMKMDPPTRSFKSFSQAALECSMSRVYLGIHFRYDSVEGNKLGTQIGAYACENFLKPVTAAAR